MPRLLFKRRLIFSANLVILVFSLLEAAGAALWCAAGGGIYGSPLSGIPGEELARIGVFLVAGPFSAPSAALVAPWVPRIAGAWFLLGGLVSGAVALTFIPTDAGVLPLFVTSLPMLGCGAWLLLVGQEGAHHRLDDTVPGRSAEQNQCLQCGTLLTSGHPACPRCGSTGFRQGVRGSLGASPLLPFIL
jgi:hypothetical protein